MDNKFLFLSDLNEQQREVCISDKSTILTACPGSGKTRTLIYRLAYLEVCFPNSNRLNLAITYTNRAAEEIKDRLAQLGIDSKTTWAGTIHQFCLQFILRPYGLYSERLKNGYHIIDEFIQQSYLSEICSKLGIEVGFNCPPPLSNPTVKRAYDRLLVQHREIDFDMILILSKSLLQENQFISSNISGILRSIHIDEYQDTNEFQYDIISLISNTKSEMPVFFIGDKNQAIYGGIGGIAKDAPELNRMFHRTFDEKILNGCYRSSQRIIDYYSNFQVTHTEIRSLSMQKESIGIISHNRRCDKSALASEIAKIISKQLQEGIPASEICVVAPQWWMLFAISKDLREKLPLVNFDAPDITPIKYDPLNVFYLIARIVFTEAGKNSARRKHLASDILTLLSDEFQIKILDTIDGRDVLKCLNSTLRIADDGIKTLKNSCQLLMDYLHVDFQNDALLGKAYEDFFAKVDDRIKRYKLSSDTPSFERCFKEKTGVVINTCTGVKGEEYTTVIAFGLLNGYLPHWDIIINQSQSVRRCESLKLLYVIGSRAKEKLFLISEQGHCTNSGNPYTPINEIINICFVYNAD